MRIITIQSYQHLLDQLGVPPDSAYYFFRGITESYRCVPSLWYTKSKDDDVHRSYEAFLLREFCQRFNVNHSNYGNGKPIFQWGLARHAGLPSRLMDFSMYLSTALFFGFEMSKGERVLIYALERESLNIKGYDEIQCETMLDSNDTFFIQPWPMPNTDLATDISKLKIQGAKFLWQPFAQSKQPIECNPKIYKALTIFEIPYSLKSDFYSQLWKDNVDMYKSIYDLCEGESWRPSPVLESMVKVVSHLANNQFLK